MPSIQSQFQHCLTLLYSRHVEHPISVPALSYTTVYPTCRASNLSSSPVLHYCIADMPSIQSQFQPCLTLLYSRHAEHPISVPALSYTTVYPTCRASNLSSSIAIHYCISDMSSIQSQFQPCLTLLYIRHVEHPISVPALPYTTVYPTCRASNLSSSTALHYCIADMSSIQSQFQHCHTLLYSRYDEHPISVPALPYTTV